MLSRTLPCPKNPLVLSGAKKTRILLEALRTPDRTLHPAATLLAILLLATAPLTAQQSTPSMPGMQDMPRMAAVQPTDDLPPLTPPTNLLNKAFARPPIALDQLLAQALTTSPTLAQARAQTAHLHAQARQASIYPNPTIGYQGDQIRGGSFGGGEQGAFLAQTIPLGGKLSARRRAFEAAADTAQATTQTAEATLRSRITQAFYAALAAQQATKIRRQLLEVAQDATQTAHQLANVGQADLPDILATEVEQEQATATDAQAQHEYLARFRALTALANQPTLALAPLSGDLNTPPSVPTLALIFQGSPQLAEARAQITAAEARLTAAHREVAPDLQLKAGEQYNFEQLNTARTQTGPQSFASAALTIPLWNRNQGNIAAAEADLEAARQNVRALQLTLQQQAQPLLETYAAAGQQATLYRTSILPRATRAVNLYETKYNAMAQAYPQVLVSRRALLTLQLHYTEILATLWSTATALQNGVFPISGLPTGGWAESAPNSESGVD